MPLILLSNDDGINSPNLDFLAEAVSGLGQVIIVAPETNQSSMGRSYPSGGRVGIITQVEKMGRDGKIDAYSVVGSPALTMCHALMEIVPKKPDLCLTGINLGENIGSTLHASGTLMGAIEASSMGIPAMAFSKVGEIRGNQEGVAFHIRQFVQSCLKHGLPESVSALNINFPKKVTVKTPIDITRFSAQAYFESAQPSSRDWSKPYDLPSVTRYDEKTLEKDSDIYSLLELGHISVTPVTWDFTANVSQSLVRQKLQI